MNYCKKCQIVKPYEGEYKCMVCFRPFKPVPVNEPADELPKCGSPYIPPTRGGEGGMLDRLDNLERFAANLVDRYPTSLVSWKGVFR